MGAGADGRGMRRERARHPRPSPEVKYFEAINFTYQTLPEARHRDAVAEVARRDQRLHELGVEHRPVAVGAREVVPRVPLDEGARPAAQQVAPHRRQQERREERLREAVDDAAHHDVNAPDGALGAQAPTAAHRKAHSATEHEVGLAFEQHSAVGAEFFFFEHETLNELAHLLAEREHLLLDQEHGARDRQIYRCWLHVLVQVQLAAAEAQLVGARKQAYTSGMKAVEENCFRAFLNSRHYQYVLALKSKELIDPSLNLFRVTNILGEGGFGKVKYVVKKDSDAGFAMKCMDKHRIVEKKQVKMIFKERALLVDLDLARPGHTGSERTAVRSGVPRAPCVRATSHRPPSSNQKRRSSPAG